LSHDGTRPRVAAFISRSTPHLSCTPCTDIVDDPDVLALDVSFTGLPTTFILCVYNERSQDSDNRQWTVERTLVGISLPARAIVCGDFNAHHSWWESSIAREQRADQLTRWLGRHGCELINTPDIATCNYHRGRGTSVLDLAFATPLTYPSICDWAVDDENTTGSDHELIRFNVHTAASIQSTVENPISWPYNYKKADWGKFAQTLQESAELQKGRIEQLLRANTDVSREQAACLLRDLILEANSRSIPYRRPSPRSKSWWNDEITAKRREMASARNDWKATRSEHDWITFKSFRNRYFRSIRQAKSDSWKEFLQGAVGKSVFHAYRYTKPRRVERTPILRHEGREVIKFGEKCELLRTVMFPPPPDSISQSQMSDSHALPWPDITSLEIKEAIFSSNPNKAPGPDGMTFLNLQQAYMAVPWLFDLIYRSLLIVGYHPHCWREGIGAILKKGNKPDYTAPKAYRVIVLLNCLGKVSEKIIAKRLSYLSEANQLLHMQQMGGRRQRTAIDAAMALTHDIQCAKNVKRITSVLFLDVKGAFDHVSKERLIQVLRQMTLPPPLLSWVRNFLSERRLGLAFDGEREAITPIDTGNPPGLPNLTNSVHSISSISF
jgi:hypothetical protein